MDSIKTRLEQLIKCDCHDPFELLGWHREEDRWILRVFMPDAIMADAINKETGELFSLKAVGDGIFQSPFKEKFLYQLAFFFSGGGIFKTYDPYYFCQSSFSEFDLYLFNEGNHFDIYKKLGAHKREVEGVSGYNFSLWAPDAKSVSLIGEFNNWDGRRNQMRSLAHSGIWEIFIPGIGEYQKYKFEIRTRNRALIVKNDPYASFFELRPANTSLTYQACCKKEDVKKSGGGIYNSPVAIYEMHLGSWRKKGGKFMNYRAISEELIPHMKETGFNWVEFMPLNEHPLDESWGYLPTGYFAPTSRYGNPDDFIAMIDSLHKNNIGVILDWVPAHFPKDDFGLYKFDGTHLYEHSDPRQRDHPDWNSAIFNYGRHEVKNFLTGSALNWLERYKIDGLRIDGVASMLYLDYSRREGEWIPNIYGGRENLDAVEFVKKFNTTIYSRHPESFTAAEESTSWPMVTKPVHSGGLGFGFKWNLGWMHDTLKFFTLDPLYRKFHQNLITFSLLYAFSENFILPLSHDEVVYGKKSILSKMPGDTWQKFANLRLLLTYMYTHPGKKLLFMGTEFAQWREWDNNKELDWHLLEKSEHRAVQKFIADLNRCYKGQPALYENDFDNKGFQWIDFSDSDSGTASFIRKGLKREETVIAVFNFTPVPRKGYRIGVPLKAFYQEIFNSDSSFYGGSNTGNSGMVEAEERPFHNMPFSIRATLPPLAGILLKPVPPGALKVPGKK